MDRRKFIQTGIAGVAGLSLVRTGLANIQMTVPSDISVDRVKLGKTGLKVSRIAMGTGTKGWNYQSNQTRLGLDNFVKIARQVMNAVFASSIWPICTVRNHLSEKP